MTEQPQLTGDDIMRQVEEARAKADGRPYTVYLQPGTYYVSGPCLPIIPADEPTATVVMGGPSEDQHMFWVNMEEQ